MAIRPRLTFRGKRFRGLAAGYRSGLEEDISYELAALGIPIVYEQDKVSFEWPKRLASYTPDFRLPKPGGFFYLETKGLWVTSDRQKHVLIKQQHPDLDLRFLFQRASTRLYKGSPTTYGQYATKQGFPWADKYIPDEWIDEMLLGLSNK